MTPHDTTQPVEILLIEDNPGDARLAIEALKESKFRNTLHHVDDGEDALDFLFRRGKHENAVRPDLILLDLNLPRRDGREVLAIIKEDQSLRRIPVVIMTMSESDEDILRSYDLHANCYITKPLDIDKFMVVIRSIEDFWLTIVTLPKT